MEHIIDDLQGIKEDLDVIVSLIDFIPYRHKLKINELPLQYDRMREAIDVLYGKHQTLSRKMGEIIAELNGDNEIPQ